MNRSTVFAFALPVASVVSAVGVPAAEVHPSAWTLVGYADSSFVLPCLTNELAGTALEFYPDRLLPAENHERSRGPLFYRYGTGFCASGLVDVPETADYVFACSNAAADVCAARLSVNGRLVDELTDGRLRLERGVARLDVWIKGLSRDEAIRRNPRNSSACVARHVLWRKAGDVAFAPVPVRPAPVPEDPVPFDEVPDLAGGRHVCYGWRTYELDVPADGLYEFGVRTVPSRMAPVTMCVDGLEALFRPVRRRHDTRRGFAGDGDQTASRRATYKADWFGRAVARRWLRKGRHEMEVRVNAVRAWQDDMPRQSSNAFMRVGWRRLPGVNALSETGFWFADRDSMVFEKGEPLELKARCAVSAAVRDWTLEVWRGEFPTNAATATPAWSRTFPVGDRETSVAYPCAEEGVFEYVIRNCRGEIVEGPWSFVVIDSTPLPVPRQGAVDAKTFERSYGECVDTVDFRAEAKGGEHHIRDNGTSSVVTNGAFSYRATGPQGHTILRGTPMPGGKGDFALTEQGRILHNEDWFAFTFKVRRPGRPHVVRAWIPNDVERLVPLYAIDRPTGNYSGWVLHAGGNVPAAGPESPLTFMVWPNADAIDLLTFNATYTHEHDKQGAVVRAELFECPEGGLAPLPEPACGWQSGRELYWTGEQMDLGVNERTMPPLKGFLENWIMPEEQYGHGYRSWSDFVSSWTRFGNLAMGTGNNFHQASISTYSMRCYRGRAERLAISGKDPYADSVYSEDVDPFDRDVFALMLMLANKYRVKMACDFMLDWITPEVAAVWAKSEGLDPTGVVLTENAAGKPAFAFGGAAVNPVHPSVRRRMVAFCEAIGERYGRYPAFAGMRHRFWPCCDPNFEPWFLKENNGFDDYTVGVFARETGIDVKSVGKDQRAWDARREELTGKYAGEWNAWRTQKCLSLQLDMLAALRKGAPKAVFFVNDSELTTASSPWKAAKGLDPDVFRRHPELGFQSGQVFVNGSGCEFNNLDGYCFANFNIRPAPYRNRDHGTNHWRTAGYPDGFCCNSSYRCHPYQLEKPAKALAENDLTRICAGGEWCLPPPDAGLASFVQVWRAIPPGDYERFPLAGGTNAAVAVWSRQTPEGLLFWAVNRTDEAVRVRLTLDVEAASVTDLVDGSANRRTDVVELALAPFMPAVRRASGRNRIAAVRADLVDGSPVLRTCDALLSREDAARGIVDADGRSYAAAVAALKAARRDGAAGTCTVRTELDEFVRTGRWWLDVLGWPAAVEYPLDYRRMQGIFANVEAIRTKAGMQMTLFTPYEEFALERRGVHPSRPLTVPVAHLKKGVALKARFAGTREGRTLRLTALFGGGYGPIRVEQEGRTLGVIPGGESAEPRFETREFPVPIAATPKMKSGTCVDLVGLGERGLGIVTLSL